MVDYFLFASYFKYIDFLTLGTAGNKHALSCIFNKALPRHRKWLSIVTQFKEVGRGKSLLLQLKDCLVLSRYPESICMYF